MNGTYGHYEGGEAFPHQHTNGGNDITNHNNQTQQPLLNHQQRTLYVGNLVPGTTEEQVRTCFEPYGKIISLKLINEIVAEPYCFVEYEKHDQANFALQIMNKRNWANRELRVNWASSVSTNQHGGIGSSKSDLAKHSHIFVGDLGPEIETTVLLSAFSGFGEISDCRVVRDPQSNKSKCYGFVSFVHREDAEKAIANMNGCMLGNRAIRTNWAQRKPTTNRAEASVSHVSQQNGRSMTLEEVYQQSGATNCTVYCGNMFNGLTEELMKRVFGQFGTIQDVRVFKDKGYAFVRFQTKDAAANAIFTMNNQEINGQTMKCSWGKGDQETNAGSAANVAMLNQHPAHAHLAQNINAAAAAAASNLFYNPYGQMATPFWYSQAPIGLAQALPGMQYGMPYANQFYPSSSPGAHHNGFMMNAQLAAMQQHQQQPPPTTPNGVVQSTNQSHTPQAPVTPQGHHHQQHSTSANVQNHHPQQPQPNGSHFGAYPQGPPPVMAYQQMQ